ncbi:hypothetical protein [Dyadobacter sp. NIV53]|uniref:hypothetical protein n=1 Tax=Dyadobacter sp. NIV53 TaxID=2861765 RepID=UPI001C87F35B|nr:hypothetical protein [Dyadobacter sp. NIV53]
MEGLRIEVHVDTGHFPEDATINVKQPSFDTREITLHITVIAVGTGEFSNPSQIVNVERHGFEIDGWQFDPTRGDVGRGGVSFERDSFDSGMHPSDVKSRDYHVVSPDTFLFSALIQRGFNADDDTWTLTFHIYLRRPRPETRPAVADLGNLMIFRRTLCTAMRSGDPCPLRAPEWLPLDSLAASFMGELPVQINNDIALDVFSGTGGSFQDSLRREVQSLLTLPDRIKQYYPQNNLDLVDSDYFKDRLVARLPESTLMTPIHQLNWISKDIVNKLGPNVTIKDLLSYSLYDLAKRLSLPVYDAATLRGKILGITPKK